MPSETHSWTDQMIGSRVGTYVISHLIGEGGMAAVFEAKHDFLPKKAAIKILRPEYSSNRDIREKFRKEAQRMASLNHVNIPEVFDFEEKPDRLSITMELLQGEDLNKRIKRGGPLNKEEATQIFEQILSAMQYAHEKGIVHRDIKPSNIYILPGNEVRILDFGIAKLFGEGEDGTRTGIQVGTPVYMSPEQVKGDRSIDHRSDIYSLGVTLYCALKGMPPYDKRTLSDFDIYQKIVFEPIPLLEGDMPFSHLIDKACQKDREKRFQTCTEWLERFHDTGIATADEPVEAESPEPYFNPFEDTPLPWYKAHRAWILVASILLVLGTAGFVYYQNRLPDQSGDTFSDFPRSVEGKVYKMGEADEYTYDEAIEYDDKILMTGDSTWESHIVEVTFVLGSDAEVKKIEKIVDVSPDLKLTDEQLDLVRDEVTRALAGSGETNWSPATKDGTPVNFLVKDFPFFFPMPE